LQPKIENTDKKWPLDGKAPILSDNLSFEEIPAMAQDQGMSKKGKGRKQKVSKKQEAQDKPST